MSPPSADRPSPPYAWYVIGVLVVCNTLSFVDRQILSLLVAPIKHDLGISDTRVGLLQGLAFALFYTFMGLPIGRVADTRSRRNLISVGVLFWSFMTASCSAAKSFWSLFLARMGVGIGEATLAPAAFSLISDYFSAGRLATAMSIYSMGIFLGSGLALIVGGMVVSATTRMPAVHLPLLGLTASWRLAFLIVGVPGMLASLLVLTVREPFRGAALRTRDGAISRLGLAQVFAQLRLRWQSVTGIAFGMVFLNTCLFGFNAWAPSVFQRVYGWPANRTGLALGLITVSFGCLGMYAGGRLCDRWKAANVADAALRVAVIGAIGNFIFFVPAFLVPGARRGVGPFGAGRVFTWSPVRQLVFGGAVDFPQPGPRAGVGSPALRHQPRRTDARSATARLVQRLLVPL